MMRNDRSIFISHTNEASPWAGWVANELEALGINTELDEKDWGAGQDCIILINKALERNEFFMALWSPGYFADGRWTIVEMNAAFAQSRHGRTQLLVFIVEPNVSIPSTYASLISPQLYALNEDQARLELRQKLSLAFKCDYKDKPNPITTVKFPGNQIARSMAASNESALSISQIMSQVNVAAHKMVTPRETIDKYYLEHIQNETRRLSRLYSCEPPDKMLRELSAFEKQLSPLADICEDNPSQLLDIRIAQCRVFGLLAYSLLDLGEADKALDCALAMTKLANDAGHRELAAWGIGTQSMIFRYNHDISKALNKVAEGFQLCNSGMAAARLHSQNVLNYSELHKFEEAMDHMKNSEKNANFFPECSDEADGIFVFSEAKHHYYAGAGFLNFNETYASIAEKESKAAIQLFFTGDKDTKSVTDGLLACIHLATAILHQGRIDEISDALKPLFKANSNLHTSWHSMFLNRLVHGLISNPRFSESTVTSKLITAVQEFDLNIKNKVAR